METLNIAFYRFVEIKGDLLAYQIFLKDLCVAHQLKGKIIISAEGFNGSLAGPEPKIREFQATMQKNDPAWIHVEYKESYSAAPPFKRMLIKIKSEIIPIGDLTIRPEQKTATRLSPQELKQWLDEKRDFVLLDTRNTYETELGLFKGATEMQIRHFRDFPEKLAALTPEIQEKPVVMYCTGGIRCEKASVVALRQGFSEVYQLDGGILKYFEECGGEHYQGRCFVFDDRIAVDSELKPLA